MEKMAFIFEFSSRRANRILKNYFWDFFLQASVINIPWFKKTKLPMTFGYPYTANSQYVYRFVEKGLEFFAVSFSF